MQDLLALRLSIIYQSHRTSYLNYRPLRLTSRSFHTTFVSPTSKSNCLGKPSYAKLLHRNRILHVNACDIVVDDLTATLQAHRKRNRVAVTEEADEKAKFKGDGSRPIQLLSSQRERKAECKSDRRIYKGTTGRSEKHPTRPAGSPKNVSTGFGEHGELNAHQEVEFREKDSILEYKGVLQPPKKEWRMKGRQAQRLTTPWLPYMHYEGESPNDKLSLEILAFEAYMKATPAEDIASEVLYADIKKALKNPVENKCLVKLLGSRSTGLATPQSDFDVSASFGLYRDYNAGVRALDGDLVRRRNMKLLNLVEKRLGRSKSFYPPIAIRARRPLVCAKHIATGLEVQVQGPLEYDVRKEFVEIYLQEFASLRPLYICIRHCLILRDLATYSKGGLGSYALLMMIVTALKRSQVDHANLTLADQLLYVLDFWGSSDTYEKFYTVDPPRVFEKSHRHSTNAWKSEEVVGRDDPQSLGLASVQTLYPQRPYLLCLQDPADYVNDLGKNTFTIKHIQQTFRELRYQILQKMEMGRSLTEDSQEQTSMLAPLLQANYLAFECQRTRIEQLVSHQEGKYSSLSERQVLEDQMARVKQYNAEFAKAKTHRRRWGREDLIRRFQMQPKSIVHRQEA